MVKYLKICFQAFSSEVQFGQRFALMGIIVKQKGHSLVTGGGASSSLVSLFKKRITVKIARAIIKKLIIVLMNTP